MEHSVRMPEKYDEYGHATYRQNVGKYEPKVIYSHILAHVIIY